MPAHAAGHVHALQVLVTALLKSMPMLLDVAVLCVFTFTVFGIAGINIFAGSLDNRCAAAACCCCHACSIAHWTTGALLPPAAAAAAHWTARALLPPALLLTAAEERWKPAVLRCDSHPPIHAWALPALHRCSLPLFGALPPATSGTVVLSNVTYAMPDQFIDSFCSGPLATEVAWVYDAGATPSITLQARQAAGVWGTHAAPAVSKHRVQLMMHTFAMQSQRWFVHCIQDLQQGGLSGAKAPAGAAHPEPRVCHADHGALQGGRSGAGKACPATAEAGDGTHYGYTCAFWSGPPNEGPSYGYRWAPPVIASECLPDVRAVLSLGMWRLQGSCLRAQLSRPAPSALPPAATSAPSCGPSSPYSVHD
jgi:hypothetical protein